MFIVFEGPEGSGKTTQIKKLAAFLEERGRVVYTTREPGGTAIADQIRQVLMDHQNSKMVPRTEILLFLASRAQHTDEVIRPRLAAGEIVLCDRYRDSTVAYQGYGHGVDLDTLNDLNDFATGGLKPDIVVLLDVEIETGLKRRATDGGWNRLDAYDLNFHKRVRKGFLKMADQNRDRWVVIDASQSPDRVTEEICKLVTSKVVLKAG